VSRSSVEKQAQAFSTPDRFSEPLRGVACERKSVLRKAGTLEEGVKRTGMLSFTFRFKI